METNQTKPEKTPVRDLFLRTIAVLGLIAILLLGAWGIIQLAFALPTVFGNLDDSISSLFTNTTTTTSAPASKESITVTMPATLSSGQTLVVSWMHSNADTSGQYSYALSYACESGLSLKAPLPTGSFETVPCNTPFDYVNASEHMNLVPSVTGSNTTLTVTVTATKLSTGAITASGSATTQLSVAQGSTATAPAKTTTSTTPATAYTAPATTYYPAATRAASLYGYGDLAVTITSVAPSATLTTIHFTIANVGTNVVNSGWTFNAILPINGSYVFGSQPQQALYPGDKIAYTLSFAGGTNNTSGAYPYNGTYPYTYGSGYTTGGYTTTGYNCNGYVCNNNNVVVNGSPYTTTSNYGYGYQTSTVTITADPHNYIPEYNKNNNTAQTTVPLY